MGQKFHIAAIDTIEPDGMSTLSLLNLLLKTNKIKEPHF